MSDTNPFGEGFDMSAMLEQAQQMQAQLMQAQERLAAERFSGSAGGATVTVTGVGDMVEVQIAPGSVTDDPESLTDLGDLIVAAYRGAKAQADTKAAQAFGPAAGDLGLGDLGLGSGPRPEDGPVV